MPNQITVQPVTYQPTTPDPFLGMRSSEDFARDPVTGEVIDYDQDWRKEVDKLFPRDFPMINLTTKMRKEITVTPKFEWPEILAPQQAGSFTAGQIYTKAGLTSAYTSGGSVGQTLYLKVKESIAGHFVEGNTILLARDVPEDDNMPVEYFTDGQIIKVERNGDNSSIAFKLTASPSALLNKANYVMRKGNMHPEGSGWPSPQAYDPKVRDNHTQIFLNSFQQTATAMQTRTRFKKDLQKDTLELHAQDIEKALLFNMASYDKVGPNGQPLRQTRGLFGFIMRDYNSSEIEADHKPTVSHFVGDSGIAAGTTWLAGGERWLDEQLIRVFAWDQAPRIAFCGAGAALGISQLVKNRGDFVFTPGTTEYGLHIRKWSINGREIAVVEHPMFSIHPPFYNTMLIFAPSRTQIRPMQGRDTTFIAEGEAQNTGHAWIDGKTEGYLTELGLECKHTIGSAFIQGIGLDHVS